MNEGKTPGDPPRIAIVGGGIIGLSIAWRLAQLSFSVTVFDKAVAGGEASWAGAGMLAPGGELEEEGLLSRLAIESLKLYPQFVRELEQDNDCTIDFQRCGAIDLAYSAARMEALDARAVAQSRLGIRSRRVSVDEVRTFWPRIRLEGLQGGRFYPDDAIVNPREVVRALRRACQHHSVDLREHCPVLDLSVEDRQVQVATAQGSSTFEAVVIAAGAWSGSIPITGVPQIPFSKPIKGHLIGYRQPDQTCNTIVRHGETYLLQRASGLLIAGASVEDVGFDRQVDTAVAKALAEKASFVLPHLGETTESEAWTGLRPQADSLYLQTWHSSSLYLAYGHYRNGILLAPVTASRIVAEVSANWEMQRAALATRPQ